MNKMMSSILETTQIITAKIVKIEKNHYMLKSGHIHFKAKKAISCMVEPSIGDKVMVCHYDGEGDYIVAVLESEVETTVNIAPDHIYLNAQQTISTFAQKANVVISEVGFLTTFLSVKSQAVTLVSATYSSIIERLTLKNKDIHQVVDGHMEQQMKSSRRVVKGCDIHQSEESITLCKGEMKIDAKQINMG